MELPELIITNVSYTKQVGSNRRPEVMTGLRRLPEVVVQRLIIRTKHHIPCDQQVKSLLSESVRTHCRPEYRELFVLASNQHGDLLLDAPIVPASEITVNAFVAKVAILQEKRHGEAE